MEAVLIRACCLILVIFTGWGLRRIGIFKEGDFRVLSTIMLKLTLPAAVVCNLNGSEVPPALLLATLAGLLFGFFYMGAGLLMNRKKGKAGQAFAMLNLSGFNIGNFALPFAQTFLGPAGVLAASIFDTGNAFVCLGGTYSLSSMVKYSGEQGGLKDNMKMLGRNLIRSVPFVAYVSMTVLCLLKITLPAPVMTYAKIIADANAFIAMLMLGVGFKLSANKEQLLEAARFLGVRYAISLSLAVLVYFFFPLDFEYRRTIAIVCLAPIAAAAPAFTAQLKEDVGVASAVNSISVVISVVLMTLAILFI